MRNIWDNEHGLLGHFNLMGRGGRKGERNVEKERENESAERERERNDLPNRQHVHSCLAKGLHHQLFLPLQHCKKTGKDFIPGAHTVSLTCHPSMTTRSLNYRALWTASKLMSLKASSLMEALSFDHAFYPACTPHLDQKAAQVLYKPSKKKKGWLPLRTCTT